MLVTEILRISYTPNEPKSLQKLHFNALPYIRTLSLFHDIRHVCCYHCVWYLTKYFLFSCLIEVGKRIGSILLGGLQNRHYHLPGILCGQQSYHVQPILTFDHEEGLTFNSGTSS